MKTQETEKDMGWKDYREKGEREKTGRVLCLFISK